jgi:hypothetical protein
MNIKVTVEFVLKKVKPMEDVELTKKELLEQVKEEHEDLEILVHKLQELPYIVKVKEAH